MEMLPRFFLLQFFFSPNIHKITPTTYFFSAYKLKKCSHSYYYIVTFDVLKTLEYANKNVDVKMIITSISVKVLCLFLINLC